MHQALPIGCESERQDERFTDKTHRRACAGIDGGFGREVHRFEALFEPGPAVVSLLFYFCRRTSLKIHACALRLAGPRGQQVIATKIELNGEAPMSRNEGVKMFSACVNFGLGVKTQTRRFRLVPCSTQAIPDSGAVGNYIWPTATGRLGRHGTPFLCNRSPSRHVEWPAVTLINLECWLS